MGVAEYSYDSIAAKTLKLYAAVVAGASGLIEGIDVPAGQSRDSTTLADRKPAES
jgi:hypothetical protein